MALINKLTAIGDAIREKTGNTNKMTLDEMASAITNISSGDAGGESANVETIPITLDCTVDNHTICDITYSGLDDNGNFCANNKKITSGTQTLEILKDSPFYVEAWTTEVDGDWATNVFEKEGTTLMSLTGGSLLLYIADSSIEDRIIKLDVYSEDLFESGGW